MGPSRPSAVETGLPVMDSANGFGSEEENTPLSYQVDLDVFNGPMDLLLYLISKEEVDIQEVSIARILEQYLAYLDRMRELNMT